MQSAQASQRNAKFKLLDNCWHKLTGRSLRCSMVPSSQCYTLFQRPPDLNLLRLLFASTSRAGPLKSVSTVLYSVASSPCFWDFKKGNESKTASQIFWKMDWYCIHCWIVQDFFRFVISLCIKENPSPKSSRRAAFSASDPTKSRSSNAIRLIPPITFLQQHLR